MFGLEADQWLIGPRPHSGHSSDPRMGGLLLHHSSGPAAAAAAGEPCALRMMEDLTDRTQVEWQEPKSNDSMNERNALTRLTSCESQDPSTFCHHSQLISGKYLLSRNPSFSFLNSPKYPCPVLTQGYIDTTKHKCRNPAHPAMKIQLCLTKQSQTRRSIRDVSKLQYVLKNL